MMQHVNSQPQSVEAGSNVAPGHPGWLARSTFQSETVEPVSKSGREEVKG
jgi:hypothetical protein